MIHIRIKTPRHALKFPKADVIYRDRIHLICLSILVDQSFILSSHICKRGLPLMDLNNDRETRPLFINKFLGQAKTEPNLQRKGMRSSNLGGSSSEMHVCMYASQSETSHLFPRHYAVLFLPSIIIQKITTFLSSAELIE